MSQLVSVAAAKDHLNIPSNDTTHDAKLWRAIGTATIIVEGIVGPVIPATFDEWHDGGQSFIQVRRRPQTGPGTVPLLELVSISEFWGSTEHALTVITSPVDGTTYSCMIDRLGTITRRSPGGGSMSFFPGTNSVHIVYRAGQLVIPANVYEATLELVRVNYVTTQGRGSGRMSEADELDTARPLGFYVPRLVREMLGRRAPAVA